MADRALQKGAEGRALLSAELQLAFDLVREAFRLHAEGKDEEARAALQGIGLQSPFLEWKLLLRGLIAFHAGDDARACENWLRLSPDRVPAQLAAPLRSTIDAAFRTSQPPRTQRALQESADRLLHSGDVLPALRKLQRTLSRSDQLSEALHRALPLVPRLRQEAPALLARLKNCLFWTTVQEGEPRDVSRYAQAFSLQEDDPEVQRLAALQHEQLGEPGAALKCWKRVEAAIGREPERWGDANAPLLCALIWERCAQIAARGPVAGSVLELALNRRSSSNTFAKAYEDCLKKSIKLVPDRPLPYRRLFWHYQAQDGKRAQTQADKLARTIVDRFPDEGEVWEWLGDRSAEQESWREAFQRYQQAVRCAPLDLRVRDKITDTYLTLVYRNEAIAEDFAQARAVAPPEARGRVLGAWAAAAFVAGDAALGETRLSEAQTEAGSRLPAVYTLLVAAICYKLPLALKRRCNQELVTALSGPASPVAIVALVRAAAHLRLQGIAYTGQPGHEKRIVAAVKSAGLSSFTELQAEWLCEALWQLQAFPLLKLLAPECRTRWPNNLWFRLAQGRSYLGSRGRHHHLWRARDAIAQVQAGAENMPEGPARRRLIAACAPLLRDLGPASRAAASPMQQVMEQVLEDFGYDLDDFPFGSQ